MELESALEIVARVQVGLISQGADLGSFGPCQNGVDGRWGPASKAGMKAFKQANAISTDADAFKLLGITEFTPSDFQIAVDTWNKWRGQMLRAGTGPGTPEYEQAANAALAASTGITPETCGAMNGDSYYAAPPSGGLPWWGWLIIAILAAGAVTGGTWAAYHYWKKKKKRRPKSKQLSGGLGDSGSQITDDEFSYEPAGLDDGVS